MYLNSTELDSWHDMNIVLWDASILNVQKIILREGHKRFLSNYKNFFVLTLNHTLVQTYRLSGLNDAVMCS